MNELKKQVDKAQKKSERIDKLIRAEAEIKSKLVEESKELQTDFHALQNELERFKGA